MPTIDEAIEVMSELKENLSYLLDHKGKATMELGIEALKRYKVIRANFGKLRQDQLPGETKE